MAYGKLTAGYEDSIWILDVHSRQERQLTDWISNGTWSLSWSPDGRTIAYSTWTTDVPYVSLIEVATGERTELAQSAFDPVWAPDGEKLSVLAPPELPEVGPARMVPFLSILGAGGERFDHIDYGWAWRKHVTGRAWSHAGDRLLVTAEAGYATWGFASLDIVQAAGGTASLAVNHHMRCGDLDCNFHAPSWFPGDTEVLFIAAVPLPPRAPYETPAPDEPEGRWWLYRAADDLSSMQVVLESTLPISEAGLSPDGTHVVFVQGESSDAELWVLDLSTGKTIQLTHNDGRDSEPVWQPQP